MYLQSTTCFFDTSISLALVVFSTALSLIETSVPSFSMLSFLSCSSLSSSSLVEMYLQSITCFLDTSISLALVISTCLSLIETSASSFSMPSNSNFDSDVISFIF